MTAQVGASACLAKWLKKPWIILLAVAVGIVLGTRFPALSMQLTPIGDLYLAFLRMCVIPIMITAVISSFGRLLTSHDTAAYLKRIGVVFIVGLMLTCVVGLVTALVINPGADLDPENRAVLGAILMSDDAGNLAAPPTETNAATIGWSELVEMLIPINIFNALAEGRNLQILFFSLVFGFAIGFAPSANREHFLDLMEVVFKAFEKVISSAMYMLPFGLLSMVAGQVASAGTDALLAMTKYVAAIHVAVLILVLISAVVIAAVCRQSYLQAIVGFREPLLVAFGTRNSYATMPSIMEALRLNTQTPPHIINLVTPLSVVLCRYSMILVFTVGSVFIARLYGVPLGGYQLAVIFVGSLLAALASAGAPSFVALSMIALVLAPLGLPVETAFVLLLAVNFIVDPALTIVNAYMACAATTMVGRRVEPLDSVQQMGVDDGKLQVEAGLTARPL